MAATPIADLKRDVIDAIMVGSVPCLWGPPGVGKTQLVLDIGRTLDLPVFTVIGSLCDPTDVNGFPVVDEDATVDAAGKRHKVIRFAPRDFLYRIVNQYGGRGLIFLDEFTGNGPAVQAAMLRPTTDWCFGDFQLDRTKVAIVCAANPPEQAANGQELALPMVNRLLHLQFPVNDSSAIEWAGNYASYWGQEPEIAFAGTKISMDVGRRARAFVAGFIAKFPKWWHKMPTESSGGTVGYATARSWDKVGRHLARCLSRNLPPLSIANLVSGEVGPAPAADFTMYLRESEIPDPEEVLKNPDGYKPTGRLDVDFVVMTGVVAAVAANVTPARLLAGMKVCNRVATARGTGGSPTYEAGVVAFGQLAKHCRDKALDELATVHKMKPVAKSELIRAINALIGPYQSMYKNVLAPLDSAN